MLNTDPSLREQIVAVERAMKRQARWLGANPASPDAPKVAKGLRELTAARDTLKLVAGLRLREGGVHVADAIDALRRLQDAARAAQARDPDPTHGDMEPA